MLYRKIDYAVAAADMFITHLHQPGLDRGMIASFGNSYQLIQPLTGSEPALHQALAHIRRTVTNEATRLYDSTYDIINSFWAGGDQRRPWVLIVLTDGKEYCDIPSQYHNNPAAIGRYTFDRFNKYDTNYMFVVAVGDDREIDRYALATMGNAGHFPAITIEKFPLLELIFMMIAIEISTQTRVDIAQIGNYTWEQVAQMRRVSRLAMDYGFLIDRSGSMTDLVHP